MTPHAALRKDICDYLTKIGAYWYATTNAGYGRKGAPDIMGCYKGRFFGIEVKVLPDKPTAWQERELNRITLCGGVALVAYSLDNVTHVLE